MPYPHSLMKKFRNSPAGRQTTAKPMDRRPKAAFVDKSLRVQGRFFSGDILVFILYYYWHFLPLRQALEATKASYLFFPLI